MHGASELSRGKGRAYFGFAHPSFLTLGWCQSELSLATHTFPAEHLAKFVAFSETSPTRSTSRAPPLVFVEQFVNVDVVT